MASSKKKRDVQAAAPSRAMEHGAKAFGAKFVKKGVALTPELDLAFALGQRSPMAPVRLLPDLAPGKAPKFVAGAVERNVALTELRGGKAAAPEVSPPPLEADEALRLLTRATKLPFFRPVVLSAVEAFVGPSVALEGLITGLEAMPHQSWDNGGVGQLFFVCYGLLLRALPAESKAARERLEALLERSQKEYGAAQLDIMLHGREGIARCGYKYSTLYKSYQRSPNDEPSNVADLCYCDGDGEFVAQQLAALWKAFQYKVINHMNGPSPGRLFFLAGDAALETELQVVEKYPGTKQLEALESYQDLASPLAVKLIERLAGPKSKVKAKAEAWLAEHG